MLICPISDIIIGLTLLNFLVLTVANSATVQLNVISLQGGPPGVPSNISRPLGQPVPAAGQNASRPAVQAWGPAPPSQRPAGPVHPPPTGGSLPVAPPPQHAVHGSEVAGPRPGGDALQMQHFGAHPPMSGPPRAGQPPTVGPPPMSQPGVPPPTLPPVNPGPQTMMNMGFGAPPESHAPGFTSQGPPIPAAAHPATSEMSGRGQFPGAPPPPSQPQMNAGMPGYNYQQSQPRGQSAGSATGGTQMTGPLSQPQPRKLDPDQMPSPVSQFVSCVIYSTVVFDWCSYVGNSVKYQL